MLKTKWVAVVVAGVLSSWTLMAVAGYKEIRPVEIGSNSASGSLGSARASGDTNQYIGCSSYGTYGWCNASDSSGRSKSCFFSGADKAAVVHSIGPQSYMYFSIAGDGMTCDYVLVSNFSFILPLTP